MYFYLLLLINLVWFLITINNYKKIYSYVNKSDQFKQINTALKYDFFSSKISDMKKLSDKSACKEATILLISIISKFFKFKNKTFYLLFTVSLFHHLTIVLLFSIISNLANYEIAFILSIFSMLCFWSNWMVLLGTHNVIGNFFFILSLFIIQNVEIISFYESFKINLLYVFLAGITSGFLIFSSPSTVKFLILIICFIYFKFGFFDLNNLNNINIIFPLLTFVISYLLFNTGYIKKKIINIFIKNSKDLSENYFNFFKMVVSFFSSFFIFNILMLSFVQIQNYIFILIFFLSLTLTIYMFLRGNILGNLKYYINYLFVHFWNYHHKNSINKKLRDISAKESNLLSSLIWVFKVIFKIQPIFIITIFISIILTLALNFSLEFLIIFFILSLPLLIFSFSNGPILSTAIYGVFFYNSIFILSICFNSLSTKFSDYNFIQIIYLVLFLEILLGIYRFVHDVLDADLFIWKLKCFIKKNKLKKIYTFNDKKYFGYFYELLNENFPKKNLRIIKTNNIHLLKKSYFIIPPLNPYSVVYHADKILHLGIYYHKGLFLLKKFKNKFIKEFNTRSSSKYFIYCGDITSYFYFYLKKIKSNNFNLGKCFIIKL